MRSTRPFTLLDAMVYVAALSVAVWVSQLFLVPWWTVLLSIERETWAKRPVWLAWHWGTLVLRHTQPAIATVTLATLVLRTRGPRPDRRRLARQPGFAACLAAAVSFLGGGCFRLVTHPLRFSAGHRIQGAVWALLLPEGPMPGLAVAATWLLLAIGRLWRPESTWIDRAGRTLGAFWIAMIPVAVFGTKDPVF